MRCVTPEDEGVATPLVAFRGACARFSCLDAGTALYYIAFGVWMVASILYSSGYAGAMGEVAYKVIRYLTYLLLLSSEILRGRYGRQTACFLLGAWAVLVGIVNAWQPIWVDFLLLVFCARGIEFEKMARISLAAMSLAVAFVVVSALVGLIPNYTSGDESGRIRCFMGFRYALYLPQYLFTITGLTLYLDGTRINLRHLVILLCANVAAYLLTDSRLSFWLAMALMGVYVMSCLMVGQFAALRGIARTLAKLLPYSVCVFAVIGIGLTLAYNPSVRWMEAANSVLGNRLSLGQTAFDLYPPTLFGQRIDFVGNGLDLSGAQSQTTNTFYVDCLYLKLLLQIGVVPSTLLLGATTCLMKRMVRGRQWVLLLVMFFIAAHCVVDDLSLNLHFNVFLLTLSSLALPLHVATRTNESMR